MPNQQVFQLFFKINKISDILFPIKPKPEEKSYSEAEKEFITDYDLENPVTKREVLKKRY